MCEAVHPFTLTIGGAPVKGQAFVPATGGGSRNRADHQSRHTIRDHPLKIRSGTATIIWGGGSSLAGGLYHADFQLSRHRFKRRQS